MRLKSMLLAIALATTLVACDGPDPIDRDDNATWTVEILNSKGAVVETMREVGYNEWDAHHVLIMSGRWKGQYPYWRLSRTAIPTPDHHP